MKNAQKPDHVSLNNMVVRLRQGRYVIPDFQRDFEWQPWDINALMRSIFRDYYIGSLLLWKGKEENYDSLACQPLYGFEGKNDHPDIVLDGQQRLTAMYYAFMAPNLPPPNRHNRYLYFIKVDQFMEENYEDAFEYDWTRRGLNLIEDKTQQYQKHMFPLSVVGASGWELPNWVQGYEEYWKDIAQASVAPDGVLAEVHAQNARKFGELLKELTEQYQISFIELDQNLELDKVCDIFTQINSRGVRLSVFDLMNALLKPKGLQLRVKLWRDAEPRLDFVDSGRMDVYILQVMSILLQAYCSPKYLYYLLPGNPRPVRGSDGVVRREILVKDTDEFEERWHDAVRAMEKVISLVSHPQEFGAISSQYLPYVTILPAFASLQEQARRLPADQRLDAQRKIRLWYWASVFTNRYSGAVDSTAARDYQDVMAWFANDQAEPASISEFKNSFKDLDLRRETRSGTSVYNGIFNLLVLRGARDWITGNVPQHGDLDDHHIVPKSWECASTLSTSIDTILNRSPLSGETNREIIGSRLPNQYLPELAAKNGELMGILESHFISSRAYEILLRDPFTPNDFEDFVTERRASFLEGIQDLLIKQRLDLSPQLRELDADVEEVELNLRHIISERMSNSANGLPEHIRQRIDERLQAAARSNPALDLDYYQTLIGKLEYGDLRELKDIIMNKNLWTLFRDIFPNKELLETRFRQIADLRNSIRHSRTVDDIMRKEGEASILWFRQIIAIAQEGTLPS